ncbi:hypothetical protein [Actinomadura sp. 3N508]|uniref:hypothetical protein n=1 Tax=Actinomadura sp. 3N508 TaxID=3375153 RepID=UPI0037B3DB05
MALHDDDRPWTVARLPLRRRKAWAAQSVTYEVTDIDHVRHRLMRLLSRLAQSPPADPE